MEDVMTKNQNFVTNDDNATLNRTPCFSMCKSVRLDKRQRRYRKIGMHRLKSTHLLSVKMIEEM